MRYSKRVNVTRTTPWFTLPLKNESDKDKSSEAWDYLGKSGKQVLLGNYTDDVTALGTVGQVATGFFDLDLPADLRDLTYDLSNWKSTPEHIIQTALDGIGVFPVLGVFKSFDEVAALAKGAKKVDNIVDAAKGTFKNEDVVGNVLDNFIKHDETTEAFISSKKAAEAADAAEDAAWYADNAIKKTDRTGNLQDTFGAEGAGDVLPNVEKVTVDTRKVTEYALNPNNNSGGANKARVFESALGYNQSNSNHLMQQIQSKLPTSKAILGTADKYGQRFTVDIPIIGPNGKTAIVRTGWILEPGSDVPRMTTIFVK